MDSSHDSTPTPTPPKPTGPRGGKRPGAGRKALAPGKTLAILSRIDAYGPVALDNLMALAEGRAELVRRRYAAAGTLKRKDVARDAAGDAIRDKHGKLTHVDVLLFPDRDPAALVLVGEDVVTGERDYKSNEYLLNRLLGRPPEAAPDDADAVDVDAALAEAHELAGRYADPDAPPGGP